MGSTFSYLSELPYPRGDDDDIEHLSFRLGIEGLVIFKRETKFDPENFVISLPSAGQGGKDVEIAVFDKVTVRISVEKDRNTQRGTVKMALVDPIDSSSL